MAHKPRGRKGPSTDEILNMASNAPAPRRAPAGRGAANRGGAPAPGGGPSRNHVRGELTDPLLLAELDALKKNRGGEASWHVLGVDRQLDSAV